MRNTFALVTLAFLCPAAYGQFSGRVTGTVVDATGAAVPGADVQLLLNGGAKALLATKTSNDGIYHFIGVRPSYYDLAVEAKGFVKTTLRNLSVDPAIETSVQTIKLELASVTTTIDVAADSQAASTVVRITNGSAKLKSGDSTWIAPQGKAYVIENGPKIREASIEASSKATFERSTHQ